MSNIWKTKHVHDIWLLRLRMLKHISKQRPLHILCHQAIAIVLEIPNVEMQWHALILLCVHTFGNGYIVNIENGHSTNGISGAGEMVQSFKVFAASDEVLGSIPRTYIVVHNYT